MHKSNKMKLQLGTYFTDEPVRHHKLIYLCALIEYIARTTKNRNRVIVNALGEERLTKIYKLADTYHSDNIARVADDLIKECNIENDYFDITDVKYAVPTHWDIAKVYKRLIISVSQDNPKQYIKTLITVYNSWIADKIVVISVDTHPAISVITTH